MHDKIIRKTENSQRISPNLTDYNVFTSNFEWKKALQELDGLPNSKGLNIAHEAVDRHVLHGNGSKIALHFIGIDNKKTDFSYQQLKNISNQFANVLKKFGVNKGNRIFVLMDRTPDLYIAALGTWKNRCVFCPLFSAFGPEPIKTRILIGSGKVLVTTKKLFQKKIKNIRHELPTLSHIFIVDESEDNRAENTLSFSHHLSQTSTEFHIEPTDPNDIALVHFTSGTTGKPKGAVHVHEAVIAHHITGKFALDFHPDDIFWCTADPGWVTGTSYGIISPLTNGITSIIDAADFDAERWYSILENEKVNVWYTAPTAIRMMMKLGIDLARGRHLPHLRFIASVGEPLNPEAVFWGMDAFNLPIHDNWWQTETGGIMVANFASMDIKPGSMGKPIPGIEASIVEVIDGKIHVIKEVGKKGELALKKGWPSMFRDYLHEEERYQKCFVNDYYLTGDLATVDEDGYFWFVGRKDDVIKSSGHLIGPFEVESALMEHPAVAEAGVIGKPDPIAMEIVKAFVSLNSGFQESDDLKLEILGFARKHLGTAVAPKEIDFVSSLPKTRSGKIMRRLLKARELGLPEGDTSTLDSSL